MSGKPIDISRRISAGALVYPGDPPVAMRPLCRIGCEFQYNILELGWTTHILTHIDAPRHFLEGGASLDDLPLERFFGRALVLAVDGPEIRAHHIPADPRGLNLLFKTANSAAWNDAVYNPEHVFVSAEAAQRMAREGVNLVGIDYLSIDRHGDEAYPAHRALLSAGVLILEGIDLSQTEPGAYTLAAFPLRIADGDGSPVRAVLFPA